jgi:hypothetical protein
LITMVYPRTYVPRNRQNADKADGPAQVTPDTFDRYTFPYALLYGDAWKDDFNPLYRNIITRSLHAKGHHAHRGGQRQRSHFELASKKCKYGFCLVWETVTRADGTKQRTRCGEVLLIESQGCGKKGHALGVLKDESPNCVFAKLMRGEEVEWSLVRDREEEEEEYRLDLGEAQEEVWGQDG